MPAPTDGYTDNHVNIVIQDLQDLERLIIFQVGQLYANTGHPQVLLDYDTYETEINDFCEALASKAGFNAYEVLKQFVAEQTTSEVHPAGG